MKSRSGEEMDAAWLLARVTIDMTSGCWLWRGQTDKKGYGRTGTRKFGTRLAHRVAWLIIRGPIPPALTIDHQCFTPPCVNPGHATLEPLRQNQRRQRSALNTRCVRDHSLADALRNTRGTRRCRTCDYDMRRRKRQRAKENA